MRIFRLKEGMRYIWGAGRDYWRGKCESIFVMIIWESLEEYKAKFTEQILASAFSQRVSDVGRFNEEKSFGFLYILFPIIIEIEQLVENIFWLEYFYFIMPPIKSACIVSIIVSS